MSFSRYNTLFRLLQISSRNAKCDYEIGCRSYSRKVLTSLSPQDIREKHNDPFRRREFKLQDLENEFNEEEENRQYIARKQSRHNYKQHKQQNNSKQQRPEGFKEKRKYVNRNEQNFASNDEDKIKSKHKNRQDFGSNDEHQTKNKFRDKRDFGSNDEHQTKYRYRDKRDFASNDKYQKNNEYMNEQNTGSNEKHQAEGKYSFPHISNFASKYLSKVDDMTENDKKCEEFTNMKRKKFTFQSDLESPESIEIDESEFENKYEYDKPLDNENRVQRIKINHKLEDDPKYQNQLMFEKNTDEDDMNEEVHEVFELKPDPSITNADNLTVLSPVENQNLDADSNSKTKEISRYKILETPEGKVEYNLSADEFNVSEFYKELYNNPGPLDECKEDISDLGPNFSPFYNFAAYADKSKLIQEYVHLGVKLHKLEKNHDDMRALLSINLEKELPMYLQFLHDCGVPADCLGDVITEAPMILKEDMDDMRTRIRYLRAHKFSIESIARIVTNNPRWLLWATKFIDQRLGHFQNEFKLSGAEVRFLATKTPKLITYHLRHIYENTFAVREEMGFDKRETKVLLLSKPRLWMNNRKKIVDSFDYLHNTMKLSHLMIASQSDVLTCRKSRIKDRHEFLVELKKAQYDPKQPGYIAPQSIVVGSNADFCRDIAKTALDTFELFLKTR